MYTFNRIVIENIKTKQARHFETENPVSLQDWKRVTANVKVFTFWQTLVVEKNDPKTKENFPFL